MMKIIMILMFLMILTSLIGCSGKKDMNTLLIQQQCQQYSLENHVSYDSYSIITINSSYAEFKCIYDIFMNISR